jgi:SpoIID/LytB domain protein
VNSAHAERHRSESMWKSALQRGQLAHLVGLDDLKDVRLVVDGESGKVCSVQVESGRDTQDLDFTKFQELVGADRIRSSEFEVEVEGDEVIFSGFGSGHGVGICLYTAEKMATRGDKASEILGTFYPDATLRLVKVEETRERKPLARRYPGRFRREAVS